MTRIEEIAARLELHVNGWNWQDSVMRGDIAYLLEEVKRKSDRADAAEAECLEQARLNGMGAERELALIARKREAEFLVLSLAEALDTLKLWALCTSKPMKKQKRDAVMARVDAALSDPRLLAIMGG